jgi:hypothetical protein
MASSVVKNTLAFSRGQKFENTVSVNFDAKEFDHKNEKAFETLFSVIFSLDQFGSIDKEITLIQDVDPSSNSTKVIDLGNITDIASVQSLINENTIINLHSENMQWEFNEKNSGSAQGQQQSSNGGDGEGTIKYVYVEKAAKFGIIDMIAYAGGIWFFLSQLTVGPIFRNWVSSKLFVADIGERLFYKMNDTKFEFPKGQRAKIDVNSVPNLKKRAEEQEHMQLPRVMINDEGHIIHSPSPRRVNKSQLMELQQPGGADSMNVSLRSDSKFLSSDRKNASFGRSANNLLTKAQGAKMTEVEENDLELEGGMVDQGTP